MHGTASRRIAITAAAALSLCTATAAWAQEKQKVTYKVGAENTEYPQRHTLEVGDGPGHTVGIFEIHRTYPASAPIVINGLRLKESWTRGYSDYVSNNGISTNYQIYIAENGDRFHAVTHSMGQADDSGKRSTVSVGHITGGTGKFAAMRGMIRSQGASDGKRGFNESSTEIEYWFAER